MSRTFYKWRNYLWCTYLEMDDNDEIVKFEAEMLKTFCPPCNSDKEDAEVQAATNAFGC